MTVGAARSLRGFVKGKTNARYSLPAILASVAYLGWESACGTLIDQRNEETNNPSTDPDFIPSDPSDLDCAKGTSGETGLNAQVRVQVVKKLLTVFGDAALNPNLEEIIRDTPNSDERPRIKR